MKIHGQQRSYDVDGDPFEGGGNARLFYVRGEDLVFKRYKKTITHPDAIRQIEALCDTGQRILVAEGTPHGKTPVSSINWPLDSVPAPGGGLAGVILPAIPSRFYMDDGRPRTLDFLILARAKPPAAGTRVPVLFRLAEILNRLEKDRLVHGDLSAKNVVWCAHPEPGAYLIDCDGLHPPFTDSPHPSFTPGWTDPRLTDGLIPEHDERSDRYALALAMYRGLLLTPGHLVKRGGRWQTPTDIPPRLDEPVRRYMTRGLSPLDARQRPTARQWLEVLRSSYIRQGARNSQRLDILDRHADRYRLDVTLRAEPKPPLLPPPRPPVRATPKSPPRRGSPAQPARPNPARRKVVTWPRLIVLSLALAIVGFMTLWVTPLIEGCWVRQGILHCRDTSGDPAASYSFRLPLNGQFVSDPKPQGTILGLSDGSFVGMALGQWHGRSSLQMGAFDLQAAVAHYQSKWSAERRAGTFPVGSRRAVLLSSSPCPFGEHPRCHVALVGGDRRGNVVWIYLPIYFVGEKARSDPFKAMDVFGYLNVEE